MMTFHREGLHECSRRVHLRNRAIHFVANARNSTAIAALCASWLIPIRTHTYCSIRAHFP